MTQTASPTAPFAIGDILTGYSTTIGDLVTGTVESITLPSRGSGDTSPYYRIRQADGRTAVVVVAWLVESDRLAAWAAIAAGPTGAERIAEYVAAQR